MDEFKEKLTAHILWMKTLEIDYARYAAKQYAEAMPWLDLIANLSAKHRVSTDCIHDKKVENQVLRSEK